MGSKRHPLPVALNDALREPAGPPLTSPESQGPPSLTAAAVALAAAHERLVEAERRLERAEAEAREAQSARDDAATERGAAKVQLEWAATGVEPDALQRHFTVSADMFLQSRRHPAEGSDPL